MELKGEIEEEDARVGGHTRVIGLYEHSPEITRWPRLSSVWGRLQRYRRQRGLLSLAGFLLSRFLRFGRHVVYEIDCSIPTPAVEWDANYQLLEFGPENANSALTPELIEFLGGNEAHENLRGVCDGNRLFVIKDGTRFLHCGYILFRTKQTKVIGESRGTPLIACCHTVATARGRGLYTKALRAEIGYLRACGHSRAVIETSPENLASRRGIEAVGFRLVREVDAWIALNLMVVQRLRDKHGTHWHADLL